MRVFYSFVSPRSWAVGGYVSLRLNDGDCRATMGRE